MLYNIKCMEEPKVRHMQIPTESHRGGGDVGLERWPRKSKFGCSNPSHDRPKS